MKKDKEIMPKQIKEIGERLVALREVCDITPEEISAKLKVSVEEYLLYEKGEADFSFSLLYNVAEIFGVDILDLMSGESPKLSVCTLVKDGKGYTVKRNHAYDYKHLAFTFKNKKAEPFLVTVEPSDSVLVKHGHVGQEFNYLLSGRMRVNIGDEVYELGKGDSVYFDSSVPHSQEAIGEKPAKFIAVVMR